MPTIQPAGLQSIQNGAKLIQNGELVAFPTETVYGLGADATNEQAIKKIFTTKERPADNPLIVHVGHRSHIENYAYVSNTLEQKIIDHLMPGPLTLIMKKKDNIVNAVTCGLPTVGIRVPDHITAQQLIRATGTALAAPSANLSGKPSPTSASMVARDIGEKIPLIIDGSSCTVGIESTVIKVLDNQTIHILRPGFITQEDLQDLCGPEVSIIHTKKDQEQSPGTRYQHYSPTAEIHIVNAIDETMIQELLNQGHNIGLIATREFLSEYKQSINAFTKQDITKDKEKKDIYTQENPQQLQPITTFPRGSHTKLLECAQSLYNLYHQCDKLKMSIVLVEKLPEKGIAYAIMNRVRKSASQ